MVTAKKWFEDSREDPVQNLEVQGVPGKSSVAVQDAGSVWVLDTRVLRTHHTHLASRPGRRSNHCPFCNKGMAAIVVSAEKAPPEYGMAESRRADQEGDTASARDSGEPG